MKLGLIIIDIIIAFATVASALVAAFVLRESMKLRKPFVAVRIVKGKSNYFTLQIKNIGGGTAHNISVNFNSKFYSDDNFIHHFQNVPFLEANGTLEFSLTGIDFKGVLDLKGIKVESVWYNSQQSGTLKKLLSKRDRFVTELNPLTIDTPLAVNSSKAKEREKRVMRVNLDSWVNRW